MAIAMQEISICDFELYRYAFIPVTEPISVPEGFNTWIVGLLIKL